jgi:hypothetical protein
VYAAGAWQAPVTVTAAPPVSGAYGQFGDPIVTLLVSSRVGLTWAARIDRRVSDPGALSVCDTDTGQDLGSDILWSESVDGGSVWTPPTVVDTAYPHYSEMASSIWVSSQLRGVLITHPSGITFRRWFDGP